MVTKYSKDTIKLFKLINKQLEKKENKDIDSIIILWGRKCGLFEGRTFTKKEIKKIIKQNG